MQEVVGSSGEGGLSYLPDFYRWSPKLLYKECKRQFLPLDCGTLQVGSLKYFRNHYDDEIADKLEGKTFFAIPGLGTWLEISSWLHNTTYSAFGEFLGSIGSPDSWPKDWAVDIPFCVDLGEISLDSDMVPGAVRFEVCLRNCARDYDLVNANCRASYTASNAFIFCLKRTPPDAENLKGYDSHWTLLPDSVEMFAKTLAEALIERVDHWSVQLDGETEVIPASVFDGWNIRRIGDGLPQPEGASIYYSVGDILYVNSPNGIMLSPNYPWDWSKKLFFNSPFFKTPKHKDEAETRIAFFLMFNMNGKIIGLNPVEQNVIIPLSDQIRAMLRE